MCSLSLAQISVRTLAILLGFKSIEFGISTILQVQLSMGVLQGNIDGKMEQMIGTYRVLAFVGAMVPLALAAGLWFSAPWLARLMVPGDDTALPPGNPLSLPETLVQVAAVVIIGLAVSSAPSLVFDFQSQLRQDPSVTLMTARAFPDLIQFLAKAFVGATLLVVVRKRGFSKLLAPARA